MYEINKNQRIFTADGRVYSHSHALERMGYAT